MLVWTVTCSEILLDRAENSSTYDSTKNVANKAIDDSTVTAFISKLETAQWLRVYFKSRSTVEKVVIEQGFGYDAACVYTVSVYDGETGTVCGTYTGKADR